jgi:CheY-like chemotaxis protein
MRWCPVQRAGRNADGCDRRRAPSPRRGFHENQEGGRAMNGSSVTILVVDDDRVDTMAIRRSLRELKIANPVVAARDGIEALEKLRGENGHDKVRSPLLVLLDLNMPRMGGLEFLDELRADPLLHSTLVFVMTTSSATEDRTRAYAKNVAGYVLKFQQEQGFQNAILMLEHYWRIVEFPETGRVGHA